MKWVKASERLPEKEDAYFAKMKISGWAGVFYFNGKRFETHKGITNDDIEWLDESPQSEQEDDSVWIEFLAAFQRSKDWRELKKTFSIAKR